HIITRKFNRFLMTCQQLLSVDQVRSGRFFLHDEDIVSYAAGNVKITQSRFRNHDQAYRKKGLLSTGNAR
ncbi:MAG: hypothetical protein WBZ33_05830, partial [Thermoactinomyces sp.]